MLDVQCPQCARILKIEDKYLGHTGTCNHCGTRLLVALHDVRIDQTPPISPPVPPATPQPNPVSYAIRNGIGFAVLNFIILALGLSMYDANKAPILPLSVLCVRAIALVACSLSIVPKGSLGPLYALRGILYLWAGECAVCFFLSMNERDLPPIFGHGQALDFAPLYVAGWFGVLAIPFGLNAVNKAIRHVVAAEKRANVRCDLTKEEREAIRDSVVAGTDPASAAAKTPGVPMVFVAGFLTVAALMAVSIAIKDDKPKKAARLQAEAAQLELPPVAPIPSTAPLPPEQLQADAKARFYAALDDPNTGVPNSSAIYRSTEFQEWLVRFPQRKEQLDQACDQLNAPAVISIFDAYFKGN